MECECKREYFPHILLFHFCKGKEAAEARKEIYEVYGVDCLRERTRQKWVFKFHFGDFFTQARSTEVDDDRIKAITESDCHITARGIAKRVNVSHTTIENPNCIKKGRVVILWDYKDVYFELFPINQTINSGLFCQQRMNLEKAIKDKTARISKS
ncbi:histone-lysine N-methyltransferase SETMAR-like [Octopus sinensis]|uniref:Histone-lysine N-methyltransferase SETMAR-like n=1 Tax=Octopus sinensis TaxID=2607531 RepID=A0A7E6FEQ2_9MOLL|nr:histone-lysine N-methyltransferase SETMAR-like [Octopus sinensis]